MRHGLGHGHFELLFLKSIHLQNVTVVTSAIVSAFMSKSKHPAALVVRARVNLLVVKYQVTCSHALTHNLPSSNRNNKHMAGLLLLATLLGSLSLATCGATPNVIFAMADDLGWGDVQYNNGKAATPNLNEMTHSPNTILLQRYCSGGPVCSPTRAIPTGSYVARAKPQKIWVGRSI